MVNLYSKRHSLKTLLFENLPSTFVVATAADHPLLLKTADLIIGGGGRLTAIYLPKSEEIRSPPLLGNRLILSKLALPAHTLHVLIIASEAERKLGNIFSTDFAAILSWDMRSDIAKLSQDANFVGAQKDIPLEILLDARTQFSDVMQITRVMRNLGERQRAATKDTSDTRSETRQRAYKQLTRTGGDGISVALFSSGQILAPTINSLVRQQVSSAYKLDDGVPYPMPTLYYGLAVVEHNCQTMPEIQKNCCVPRLLAAGQWFPKIKRSPYPD
jgi:hypothetical protein